MCCYLSRTGRAASPHRPSDDYSSISCPTTSAESRWRFKWYSFEHNFSVETRFRSCFLDWERKIAITNVEILFKCAVMFATLIKCTKNCLLIYFAYSLPFRAAWVRMSFRSHAPWAIWAAFPYRPTLLLNQNLIAATMTKLLKKLASFASRTNGVLSQVLWLLRRRARICHSHSHRITCRCW